MEYDVIVEYDPTSRHYTATIAGIPEIVVDAKTEASVIKLAREAIEFYRDERPPESTRATVRPTHAKVVSVEV